jgi:uncharacterized protein (DUF488 family)
MEIYSIGFTKKSAEQFFSALRSAGIRRLVDVRLNNVSQLAGFAKKQDLPFFLRELCEAEYLHEPLLAPTQQMLDDYKKRKGAWAEYEARFLALMAEREIERRLDRASFEIPSALLCSELSPDQCHRRLVLEYLREKWGEIKMTHL